VRSGEHPDPRRRRPKSRVAPRNRGTGPPGPSGTLPKPPAGPHPGSRRRYAGVAVPSAICDTSSARPGEPGISRARDRCPRSLPPHPGQGRQACCRGPGGGLVLTDCLCIRPAPVAPHRPGGDTSKPVSSDRGRQAGVHCPGGPAGMVPAHASEAFSAFDDPLEAAVPAVRPGLGPVREAERGLRALMGPADRVMSVFIDGAGEGQSDPRLSPSRSVFAPVPVVTTIAAGSSPTQVGRRRPPRLYRSPATRSALSTSRGGAASLDKNVLVTCAALSNPGPVNPGTGRRTGPSGG